MAQPLDYYGIIANCNQDQYGRDLGPLNTEIYPCINKAQDFERCP